MSTRIGFTILAMVLILNSAPVSALGLGDARVQSFIGQALELHIDLLTSPGDDLGDVSARLASAEDFALIGASREAISVPLNFQVREGDASSGAYILVTSRLAVNNPVLRLVVEVNWSSGRLLREYTIFLDPPTVPSQAPAPVSSVSEPESPAETAQDVADTAPEPVSAPSTPPVPASSAVIEESAAPDSRSATSSSRYGPVENGETLWQIANTQMGDSGLDMNRIMLAIQRKNPGAFVNDNINLLKRGASLDMPTEEEVAELSSAQARELVAQQEAAFRMRSTLASSSTPLVASQSAPDTSGPASPESSRADTGSSDDAASLADESIARLEIVPASEEDLAVSEPGAGTVPGGEGSEAVEANIREELARTEEALISAQQENNYLQDRIAELEAQLGETGATASEGLVADDEMADLEERLESERLAAEEEAAAVAEPAANQPPVVTPLSDDSDAPWYSGTMTWIIMILIVVAAAIGWIFNRRRSAEHYELDSEALLEPVSGLKDEAEDILRTLDSEPETDEEPGSEDDEPASSSEDDEDPGDGGEEIDSHQDDGDEEAEPSESSTPSRDSKADHGDATVLDENSSDPEIQLDLARAYISMGDKEAARAILDEVLNLGNEEQKAEARDMLDKI